MSLTLPPKVLARESCFSRALGAHPLPCWAEVWSPRALDVQTCLRQHRSHHKSSPSGHVPWGRGAESQRRAQGCDPQIGEIPERSRQRPGLAFRLTVHLSQLSDHHLPPCLAPLLLPGPRDPGIQEKVGDTLAATAEAAGTQHPTMLTLGTSRPRWTWPPATGAANPGLHEIHRVFPGRVRPGGFLPIAG